MQLQCRVTQLLVGLHMPARAVGCFLRVTELPCVCTLHAGGPGSGHVYVQLVSKQMVGTYISVWVRKALLPHVRGVQATHVATGFGGMLGNKGA